MTEKIKIIVESVKAEISIRIDEIKEKRSKNRIKRYVRGIVKSVCVPFVPIIGIDTYREMMNAIDEYTETFYNLAMESEATAE